MSTSASLMSRTACSAAMPSFSGGSPPYLARGMTRKKYVAWAPAVTSSSATRLPGIAIRNQIFSVSLPGSCGDMATQRGAAAPAVAHSDL